jgi:hypothetical protein
MSAITDTRRRTSAGSPSCCGLRLYGSSALVASIMARAAVALGGIQNRLAYVDVCDSLAHAGLFAVDLVGLQRPV